MAKKILSEAQMRRFAKLANLSPVNEMMSSYEEDMEEEMPEMGAEEAPEDMGAEMDAEEPEMDAAPEMDAEMELSKEEAEVIMDLADKLRAAMGDEAEEEMDAAPEMDAEMDAAPEAMEDEEAMEMMEALKGINYVPGKKDIVEEVARRVAKRLLKAKKADRALKEALGSKK